MSTESVMPSNHLILCCPLILTSICPSFRIFSSESALHIRWPKYWSFSFSISPSSEYLGLISFKIDWFGLLAVQGTLKSLLQHHSSKASILRHSAFFMKMNRFSFLCDRMQVYLKLYARSSLDMFSLACLSAAKWSRRGCFLTQKLQ